MAYVVVAGSCGLRATAVDPDLFHQPCAEDYLRAVMVQSAMGFNQYIPVAYNGETLT